MKIYLSIFKTQLLSGNPIHMGKNPHQKLKRLSKKIIHLHHFTYDRLSKIHLLCDGVFKGVNPLSK